MVAYDRSLCQVAMGRVRGREMLRRVCRSGHRGGLCGPGQREHGDVGAELRERAVDFGPLSLLQQCLAGGQHSFMCKCRCGYHWLQNPEGF